MGGLKKHMPITALDLPDRLHRHRRLPHRQRLLLQGRDPLEGLHQPPPGPVRHAHALAGAGHLRHRPAGRDRHLLLHVAQLLHDLHRRVPRRRGPRPRARRGPALGAWPPTRCATSTAVHASDGAVHAHGAGHAAHAAGRRRRARATGPRAHAAAGRRPRRARGPRRPRRRPPRRHAARVALADHAGAGHPGRRLGADPVPRHPAPPGRHLPPVLEHWLEPVAAGQGALRRAGAPAWSSLFQGLGVAGRHRRLRRRPRGLQGQQERGGPPGDDRALEGRLDRRLQQVLRGRALRVGRGPPASGSPGPSPGSTARSSTAW